MNLTTDQINKYYGYAYSIAGDLYMDLFHHVYLELPDNIKHPDAYIYRSMFNAYTNKKSTFNKLYSITDNEPCDSVPVTTSSHSKYDSFLLHKILLELEQDGFDREVLVYKEVKFTSNIVEFSRKVNINRRTISKIINFIDNEIRTRYNDHNS